ncbi:hypothetical protein GCM10027517_39280 [Phycicoccus ginsengisoli]
MTGPKVKLAPEPSGPNNVPSTTTHPIAFHCPPHPLRKGNQDELVLTTRESASAN